MKQLKNILPVVLTVLLGCLPLMAFLGILRLTPAQYDHTFYGELDEKHDRLSSIDKPKIVVVGGSSVAFGLDSQMIEEKTGYEVVNFGLYADLGTKIMLDLSRRHINEGDIVIIAPEMDEQTLSLYFNGSSALKATDGKPSMLFELDGDDWYDIWGALWGFAGEKWSYFKNGTPDPEGVYNSKNFNKYGDISPDLFKREENIMVLGYDTFKPLQVKKEIFSQDFVDYLNSYIDELHEEGAAVYYGFCPMNEVAVEIDLTSDIPKSEQITNLSDNLLSYLQETLHCPVLGTPEEAMMPTAYFYDSNFHLNDYGVPVHTARLIDNLLQAEQKENQNVGFAVQQETGYRWSDTLFVYEREADGTCTIIDTTLLASRMPTLCFPSQSEGLTVSKVANYALENCKNLNTVLFPSDSAVTVIEDYAFGEIASLNMFYFYGSPPSAFPSHDKLKTPTARINVQKELLSDYQNSSVFESYSISIIRNRPEDAMIKQCADDEYAIDNEGLIQTEDQHFLYTLMPSGTWEITGLTALGKMTPVLIVPATVPNDEGEEIAVTSVGNYAMKGAKAARALVITSDSLVSQFGLYVFANSSVDGLYMFVDPTNITTTVAKPMVIGAPSTFKIYIDDGERLAAYSTDYGWGVFSIDGYYELSDLSETDLLDGDVTFASAPNPMTRLVLVLAAAGVGLALGIGGYFLLCAKKRKKANAKEEF